MNPDVKQKAEDLAEALANSPEYQNFVEARESLDNHEAAKIMLRDFQQKQAVLQQKVLSGQQLTETDTQELQQAYQVVALNPYVRKAIEAEAAFAEMLTQVQQIIGEAVGIEGPDDQAPDDEAQTSPDRPSQDDEPGSAGNRLWVPGR